MAAPPEREAGGSRQPSPLSTSESDVSEHFFETPDIQTPVRPHAEPRRRTLLAEHSAVSFLRNLPLSREGVGDLLHSVTEAKGVISSVLLSSKETVERRKRVNAALMNYHDHLHEISSAYLQILTKLETISACSDLFEAKNVAGTASAEPPSPGRTYAAAAAGRAPPHPEVLHFSRGPPLVVPKNATNRVIIEPAAANAARFATAEATRQALHQSVNPVALGIKISKLSRVRNNGLRLHAAEGDLRQLMDLDSLRDAGLTVRQDVTLKPRMLLHGVPTEMSRETILANLLSLNLTGRNTEGTRIIYVYPSRGRFTRCVIEMSAENRKHLINLPEVSLGWSACRLADHVRVLQ